MTRRRRGRGGSSAQNGSGAKSVAPSPAGNGQAAVQKSGRRWYKADLHTHTPASNDYEEPGTTYLQWLRTAAERGLDIVAITDHNTVAGVAAIRREVEWLIRLKEQGRLTESERQTLAEWSDLSNRVLVLPGFEFTATFGFHILGIFPPETSVRTLEYILLSLKVPGDKLDIGSTETGSTTDVLTAYRLIHEAGGLAIAAHANSTHGVAMRSFPFGGQTKIAYTQDVNLDALEVTDLENRAHSTARFFNGSKSEYPRRMHAIQGSDAHRLTMDPRNPKRLGIGERATEFLLDEPSFDALAEVLRSTQWDRTRPARSQDRPVDPLATLREEGNTHVQSFHDSAQKQGGRMDAVLNDLCAFANSGGGTVYVGASLKGDGPRYLSRPKLVEDQVVEAVEARIVPPIDLKIDTVPVESGGVLRMQVAGGDERPYALDGVHIYVREGAATTLARRDAIVSMVLAGGAQAAVAPPRGPVSSTSPSAPARQSGERQQNAGGGRQPSGGRGQAGDSRNRQTRPVVAPPAPAPARENVKRQGAPLPAPQMDTPAPMPAQTAPLQAPAAEAPVAESTPAKESAPAKSASPSRSRSSRSKSTTPAATPEVLPVAEASTSTVATPEIRLAPVVETSVTAATASTSATAAPVEAADAIHATTTAVPPKKSPSTRKSAAPSKAATTLASTPLLENAAGGVEEPPVTRKRTTRKSAAVPQAAETVEAPATLAVSEPSDARGPAKPARKSSSGAKKSAPAKSTAQSDDAPRPDTKPADVAVDPLYTPQIGVEIVSSDLQGATRVHTIRDLRNGNLARNVSRKGARDLWNYAITKHEVGPIDSSALDWQGDIALVHVEKRAGKMRYDLALREGDAVRVFYGVTEDGMEGRWSRFVATE